MRQKLNRKKKLEIISSFFSLLIEGKSVDEITEETGLLPEEVAGIHQQLIELKTEELKNKPVEHTFVEYMLDQMRNMSDLTKLINDFDNNSRNLSAVVGAIKVRSEISDKLLQRGQDCGVIKKMPTQSENKHAIYISGLSSAELRNVIVEQYRKLAKMTANIKEENIVELKMPDSLHYGEGAGKLPEEKDMYEDDIDDEITIKKPKKKKKKKRKRQLDE